MPPPSSILAARRRNTTSRVRRLLTELLHPCRWAAAVGLLISVTALPAFAADTGTIGGPGGGAFRLMCPGNQVLVGLTGRAGEWMDQVAPVCVTVHIASWVGTPRPGRATGGSGGGPFTSMCPRDSVVVGFSGYSLEYVFNIGLTCRHMGPKGVEWKTASPTLVGGTLDIGSTAGFFCPADHAAYGIIGRSGSYVDRFGLAFEGYIDSSPVPAPAPAPAPPRPRVGDLATGTLHTTGPATLLPRWLSQTFPPPNGGLLVFTIMPDGNPACASYDGARCLWGVPLGQIDLARLKPLACGEPHRARWGVTGFEDPKHWCSLARRRP